VKLILTSKFIYLLHRLTNEKYSLICAMSFQGVPYFEIINTSKNKVNGVIFQSFLGNLITVTPNRVKYYMDNCSFHHSDFVRAIMDFCGVGYVFSSPYSPDYNPIELMFGFVKLRVKDYNHLSIPEAIRKALSDVTSEMCQGWIRHAVRHWESDAI